jgi:outer membrane lipoprotein carrier protein
MKELLLLILSVSLASASLNNITSFKADFIQTITDDKQKVLKYEGSIVASKPQNALWKYRVPVEKDVYINAHNVTIIEPEIEQVIIKEIESNFDFFKMIHNAKKIDKNHLIAHYKDTAFTIELDNEKLLSISYIDEFENDVKIIFSHQIENKSYNISTFTPNIPLEFDIIRD